MRLCVAPVPPRPEPRTFNTARPKRVIDGRVSAATTVPGVTVMKLSPAIVSGPVLSVAGAVHDAASACWSIKRYYGGPRPITMIRFIGSKGQSSDVSGPSYHSLGLGACRTELAAWR